MNDHSVESLVESLGLGPHPEGGFFVETWRCGEEIEAASLPARYGGARPFGTSIYYLLTPEGFSAMHRLESDEVWHLYAGSPVEMLLLHPSAAGEAEGLGETVRLGMDLARGERPQQFVSRGTWQGARVVPGGPWSLVGCTVTPGFAFVDFELGRASDLVAGWPTQAEAIGHLTR